MNWKTKEVIFSVNPKSDCNLKYITIEGLCCQDIIVHCAWIGMDGEEPALDHDVFSISSISQKGAIVRSLRFLPKEDAITIAEEILKAVDLERCTKNDETKEKIDKAIDSADICQNTKDLIACGRSYRKGL